MSFSPPQTTQSSCIFLMCSKLKTLFYVSMETWMKKAIVCIFSFLVSKQITFVKNKGNIFSINISVTVYWLTFLLLNPERCKNGKRNGV